MLIIPSTTNVKDSNSIDILSERATSINAEISEYGFGVWISEQHGAVYESVALARGAEGYGQELCEAWEQEAVLNDDTLYFADGSKAVAKSVVQRIVKRNWRSVAARLAAKYGGATVIPAPSGSGWLVWALVF